MPKGIYPRPPRKAPSKRLVRTLRPGEERPGGEPYRYPDRDGYVRLRWKVGPNEYVEIREHRAVIGEDAEHVHHLDHYASHNDPSNLIALTAKEHLALHGREHQRFDRVRAEYLYAAGLTTIELGRLYGVHPATISRGLRKAGVQMRSSARPFTPVDEARVLQLHDSGIRAKAIAPLFGVGYMVIRRVLRENGRKPHPPGRPPHA